MTSGGDVDALLREGIQLLSRGDRDGARERFEQVLADHPDHPGALMLTGMLALSRGDTGPAARRLERLLKLQPQSPDALHGLGRVREAQGRLKDAADCYNKALAVAPMHGPSLTGLGALLSAQGRIGAALEVLQRAVSANPKNGEAHYHLGIALSASGRVDAAIGELEAACALTPGNPKPLAALVPMLVATRRWNQVLDATRRWSELSPRLAEPWVTRGAALMNLQRVDEALQSYRQGHAIDPDDPAVLCGLCSTHRVRGEFEQAFAMIEPLLKKGSRDPLVIKAYASLAPSIGRTEDAAKRIGKALSGGKLNDYDRRMLCFNGGDLYDKLGDYDRAFRLYREGNGVKIGHYDPQAMEADIGRTIEAFAAKGFRGLPRAVYRTERPVLVVGMPRSGTTLVEQILASHPQAAGAGELPHLSNMPGALTDMTGGTPYPGCLSACTLEQLDTLARAYDDKLASVDPQALRVTDKMPHNFLHLGLAELLLPGARVIHIMRDPVDTCLSNYFQDFASPGLAYANDLTHLGHHYRQYQRIMAHWRQVLSLPLMEIRYEDLVADQERVTRELIAFIGLEWDDACLSFHKTKRTVSTASYAQVRNPIYNKSVERWRRYEKHLGLLLEALGLSL